MTSAVFCSNSLSTTMTDIRRPTREAESPTMWRKLWREFKRLRRFETIEMEKLFQRYVLQANKIHLTHLLGLLIATLLVMLLGLSLIVVLSVSAGKDTGKTSNRTNDIVTIIAVFFSIVVFSASLGGLVFHRKTSEGFLLYISYALTATFMVLEMTLTRNATNLWATAFFVYITYALLPVRLLEATISGICLSIVHIPPFQKEIIMPSFHKLSANQKFVNLILLLSVNVVGILTHFPADMAKRKAFSEIRQFVRAKITIQKETVRQQRLLMSVLPEHLIEEMKSDLAQEGGIIGKRKIYIKSYEPVSILFADIVGFTSLADQSPASFVVDLLNELYCSFDKLARKNRCMRIKLLGDCYYCVCGLPKPSSLHASHCVNMGLDMINQMEAIREKFSVDVDIRVGIHTGKLQCGVLGLKKWQFDIWSSDVELANIMESGGLPGKVHISETTKNYLKSESANYVIERAYGGSRESALSNIDTYFVTPSITGKVRISQRVPIGPHCRVSQAKTFTSSEGDTSSVPLFNPLKRERDVEKELIATLYNSINSRSIRRLKKKFCKSVVLRFKNRKMERDYNREPDQMLHFYFIAAFVVFCAMSCVQLMVMPRTARLIGCTGTGVVWTTFANILVMARKYRKRCPLFFSRLSCKFHQSRNLAQLLAIATILISYVAIAIPMVSEESYVCRSKPDIKEAEARSLIPLGSIYETHSNNSSCAIKTLPYPEHTLLYTLLIMIMTGAFQIIMFTYKFLIMLTLCTAYAVLLMTAPQFLKSVVAAEAAIKYFLMIMALASFLLLMLIQSQQSEIVHRLDFVWKLNARSDTENAQQLQKFNQKLIENMLPAHVARYYLEKDRPSDELYHEDCFSTCILFASITKFSFSDEDGEDSERNIAILHDIISDIDELLNDPLFTSVEKIKSTGAIYMAASGLSLNKEDAETHHHVVALAYFALSLRSQIQQINLRHNTRFGVKIGICMGPVVAGVIGASMPQYDIWGNTVNVASRMYSTGLEDRIQVTENFALIASANGFSVERRGTVNVKGKGSMVTYFLNSGPIIEDENPQDNPPPQGPNRTRNSPRRWSWKFSKTEGTPNPRNSQSDIGTSSKKSFNKTNPPKYNTPTREGSYGSEGSRGSQSQSDSIRTSNTSESIQTPRGSQVYPSSPEIMSQSSTSNPDLQQKVQPHSKQKRRLKERLSLKNNIRHWILDPLMSKKSSSESAEESQVTNNKISWQRPSFDLDNPIVAGSSSVQSNEEGMQRATSTRHKVSFSLGPDLYEGQDRSGEQLRNSSLYDAASSRDSTNVPRRSNFCSVLSRCFRKF